MVDSGEFRGDRLPDGISAEDSIVIGRKRNFSGQSIFKQLNQFFCSAKNQANCQNATFVTNRDTIQATMPYWCE